MHNWMPEGIDNNVTGITSFRENGRRKTFFQGVLKKSDFFNTPAESADRIPQILLENCGFCHSRA